eukprot:6203548-Pleurochrysis_carterae.AAC.1
MEKQGVRKRSRGRKGPVPCSLGERVKRPNRSSSQTLLEKCRRRMFTLASISNALFHEWSTHLASCEKLGLAPEAVAAHRCACICLLTSKHAMAVALCPRAEAPVILPSDIPFMCNGRVRIPMSSEAESAALCPSPPPKKHIS